MSNKNDIYILPMMSTSAVQFIADETINILHWGGSNGNSAI